MLLPNLRSLDPSRSARSLLKAATTNRFSRISRSDGGEHTQGGGGGQRQKEAACYTQHIARDKTTAQASRKNVRALSCLVMLSTSPRPCISPARKDAPSRFHPASGSSVDIPIVCTRRSLRCPIGGPLHTPTLTNLRDAYLRRQSWYLISEDKARRCFYRTHGQHPRRNVGQRRVLLSGLEYRHTQEQNGLDVHMKIWLVSFRYSGTAAAALDRISRVPQISPLRDRPSNIYTTYTHY